MHSKAQIETDLILGMRRISVPYRKALDILRQQTTESAASKQTPPQFGADVCLQLRPSMEMIADCEQQVAPLRAAWNKLQEPADGELRRLIDEHSDLLSELIELLNGVEQTMLTSRSHLGPQVDDSQRRNVMRQAYTIQK